MFFKSFGIPFVASFRDADRARSVVVHVCPVPSRLGGSWANQAAGVAARAHLLFAQTHGAASSVTATNLAGNAPRHVGALRALRHFAVRRLRQAAVALARAVFTGRPLTPTGYAILALMVMAVALVAALSTSSTGGELESALRLSWWFC